MNKNASFGNVSRDTSPIIGQGKWLCHPYLKEYADLDRNNKSGKLGKT